MATAVTLVLLGSVAHAAWNLLAARSPGGPGFVWVYSVWSLLLLGPVAVAYAVVAGQAPTWTLAGAAMVSGLLHTAYAVALQRAYAGADLNVAYPVSRGLGPVLVVLVAVAALHERLGPLGWAGLALITVGIGVVSLPGPSTGSFGSGHRRRAGVLGGVAVGVCIAAYTLWDDRAMAAWGLDPILYYAGTGLLQLLAVSVVVRGRFAAAWGAARGRRGRAALVGVLVPVAYVLVLVAMRTAPVSVVAPLRGTSIVIGSLAAWLLLREPHGARRLLGALLVAVGVAAMVAG